MFGKLSFPELLLSQHRGLQRYRSHLSAITLDPVFLHHKNDHFPIGVSPSGCRGGVQSYQISDDQTAHLLVR